MVTFFHFVFSDMVVGSWPNDYLCLWAFASFDSICSEGPVQEGKMFRIHSTLYSDPVSFFFFFFFHTFYMQLLLHNFKPFIYGNIQLNYDILDFTFVYCNVYTF